MKENKDSPLGIYTMGICALFLAGFLLLVILGAQTYRRTAEGQETNNHTRAQLSWLSAVIRANDREGAVYLSEQKSPEDGTVLVVEDGSGYASRIYRYDGFLVEDYGAVEGELQPESALKIGPSALFEVELRPEENALTVTSDEGSIYLTLRSSGGVAGS